jgi:hypothetical protein
VSDSRGSTKRIVLKAPSDPHVSPVPRGRWGRTYPSIRWCRSDGAAQKPALRRRLELRLEYEAVGEREDGFQPLPLVLHLPRCPLKQLALRRALSVRARVRFCTLEPAAWNANGHSSGERVLTQLREEERTSDVPGSRLIEVFLQPPQARRSTLSDTHVQLPGGGEEHTCECTTWLSSA